MRTTTFRTWVRAELDTVWAVVLDSVENPQRYMPEVEAVRVLERLEGGITKELKLRGMESASGCFDFFVFERGTLKEIKSTENSTEHVSGVFDSFVFESSIIREVTVRSVPYRERIRISNRERKIHRELIDHPTCCGKIIVAAVPISVQNPMTPVDLQFFLELEFMKGAKEGEEGITAEIKEEQQRLKEKSEELETRALRR
ncbi:hypothetical protein KI811_05850 [Geobacter hydrogenophilus]|uniref:Uncharacterized protein n=1 Tax=Geobacter hydrogenophilus TaxID=40983 RepID=A0A9W6G1R2_9BACT|nr:SRPBCC family protein [Geobacter hydrogenophilus]MBT0893336.1 hypothetical protein [Geobacter hydrogenophilus]GLI38814.1 hypothetical protein GHYDROH2_23150 [Geobacter hydrogenophilus]